MGDESEARTETNAERNKRGQFQLGHTGSGGRPRGSRNKLTEALLHDVVGAWQKHGAIVLEKLAVEDPATFAKVASNLVPRNYEIDIDAHGAFSRCETVNEVIDVLIADHGDPAELLAFIDDLRRQIVERVSERAKLVTESGS
jgi:hypothetical protein